MVSTLQAELAQLKADCANWSAQFAAIRKALDIPDTFTGSLAEFIAHDNFEDAERFKALSQAKESAEQRITDAESARDNMLDVAERWQAKAEAAEQRVKALTSLLREVAGSGISWTAQGRYYEVQISVELMEQIKALTTAGEE